MIGRRAEVDAIDALLRAARDGYSALVLEGDAGIGKTRVLDEALDRAGIQGFRPLVARPTGSELQLAFAGLTDLVADAQHVFDALPPLQAKALRVALLLEDHGPIVADERTVAAALLSVLRALSGEEPLVVAIDDLQWLDAASERALAFSLRRLREEPIAFIATVRTGARERIPRLLLDDVTGDNLPRHVVGPLTLAAVYELIDTRLSARLTRPTLLRVHEAAGGNPLFALELAHAVIERGVSLRPGDPLPVPTELSVLVLERLGRLPRPARDALAAAAALARPTVADVCRAEGAPAAAALDKAAAAGAIEYEGDRIRFVHPLIATIHYGSVSPARRRALHRRLSDAVRDREERVRHLALSAGEPDEAIAVELDAAAHEARARGAPVAAADLVERALVLTPAGSDAVRDRRLAAAGHHFASGDSARARELLELLLGDAPDAKRRAEALGALARVALGTEDIAAALEYFKSAAAEPDLPDALRASLLEGLAQASSTGESLDAAVVCAREAVELAAEEDKALLAQCLATLARVEYERGRELTPGALERAVELERSAGVHAFDTCPSAIYAQRLLDAGDLDGARALLEDVCRRAREAGDPSLSRPLYELGSLEFRAGHLDRAEALTREAYEVAVQAGREVAQSSGLVHLGWVVLARGHVEEAREIGLRALGLTKRTGRAGRGPIGLLGGVELASGEYERAWEYCQRNIEINAELGSWLPHQGIVDGIEVLGSLSRFAEARAQLELVEAYASRFPEPGSAYVADHCRGILAAAEGSLEVAAESFERVVSADQLSPLDNGEVLVRLGTVQRRLRRKQAARATLERALGVLQPAGAELWAARAREELGRIGGRAATSEGLSAMEQRIVELVSAGRKTREVAAELHVSAKTVEWNLTRIYRKLGIRSRTELAARVNE
jgi:tetratricopeptide (TPR) repeat protein